ATVNTAPYGSAVAIRCRTAPLTLRRVTRPVLTSPDRRSKTSVGTSGHNQKMRPSGHENVATVLVDPDVLADFELDLMAHDFRVWAVHRVTTFPDAPRLAFQLRRSLIDWSQGR